MLVYRAGALKDAGKRSTTETSIAKSSRPRPRCWCADTRDPGPRRRGLRRRPPGRALLPRRARDDDLRGHLADPEADHRPRGRPGINALVPRALPRDGSRRRRRRRRRHDGRRASRSSPRDAARGRCSTTPSPARSSAASSAIATACERRRGKGRLRRRDAARRALERGGRRSTTSPPCELVIEAAPESLELKRELFARARGDRRRATRAGVEHLVDPDHRDRRRRCRGPSASSGMHFFNPAPVMQLVEVIAGVQSGRARARGRPRGRRGDGQARHRRRRRPGLPRQPLQPPVRPRGAAAAAGARRRRRGRSTASCARRRLPHGAVRAAGPRRDRHGFEVSRSFHELSFGEPRWRPSPLSARMVAAGAHGRKTGRGWYDYEDGAASAAPDPPPPRGRRRRRALVVITGELPIADAAARRWRRRPAGRSPSRGERRGAVADRRLRRRARRGRRRARAARRCCCAPTARSPRSTAAARAAGFHALPPLEPGGLVELTRRPGPRAVAAERAEALLRGARAATRVGRRRARARAGADRRASSSTRPRSRVGEGVGSAGGHRRRAWCSG